MTWDQTSLSPENFNILLKARLISVTLLKALFSWNTEAHMCEREILSVPVCMCRMVHQCRLCQFHLPTFSCRECCLLHSCQLLVLKSTTAVSYTSLPLPNQQHWSLKPSSFYWPLGVAVVYCTLLWGNIIVLVANLADRYNSDTLSHHWYHHLTLVGFVGWGWTGGNKPKVSVIAWVSEADRLKEDEISISGTVKNAGFATFKSCLPDGFLCCYKLVSLMKT